jgi:uncharacterized membrane protein YfcA
MLTPTLTVMVLLLGVVSGALTTLAGLGGGMLLLLALALVTSPQVALAVTAPALLLSNLHRAWVYRGHIARPVAWPFALGALPGSLLGALALPALPAALVQGLMVVMTVLAIARSSGRLRWKPRAAQVLPAGFGIGLLAATSGGAGLLAAPLLMAAGLTAEPYVATAASGAVAMHVGRVLGYGGVGLLDRRTLALSAALTAVLLVGNALGVRARRWIPQGASTRIELAALTVSVCLALAGAAR